MADLYQIRPYFTIFRHFSLIYDPLTPDEHLIMLNSIRPHGCLMITVNHTNNFTFKSAKKGRFRGKMGGFPM